jgi:dolichol-phosphate mannosyltransferase
MVQAIRQQVPDATIWIIDDRSPDGTGQIADQLAADDPRIEVTHRPGKMGLGTAYAAAFQRALSEGYDCILEMDADFSHDPRYLPDLIAGLRDADLVIGSRYVPGGGTQNWSRFRQGISRIGNAVARIGLGVRTHDATGGYRAFRRTTLEHLRFEDLKLRGYGFQIEVVYQLEHSGLRIKEIPIIFVERAAGESKMSKSIVAEAVLHILRRRLGMLRPGKTARHPDPKPQGTELVQK